MSAALAVVLALAPVSMHPGAQIIARRDGDAVARVRPARGPRGPFAASRESPLRDAGRRAPAEGRDPSTSSPRR